MKTNCDWEKTVRKMERLMRLKSFPVAFKLLENKSALNGIPYLRRLTHKSTLCQLINLARNFDWTVGADTDDLLGQSCASVIGLAEIPEFMKNGTFRSIVWTKSRADGKKYENSIPRVPVGRYQAVVMAPLVYNPFEPDMVLIYANPAQMILLINSLQFENYEVMEFYCVGETSCADAIARCYLNQKPSLAIPCYGERRYGHAQDDELVMAIPAGMMEKALKGMETLYHRGIRYPISYAGAEQDVSAGFPGTYGSQRGYRGDDNRLLLGVTGGIATGKTTVSNMLQELGAPVIDFDQLSRMVVEPGKPAWKEIVDYFGRQILQEDGSLDRKKLSEIVFRDLEKRKKLESFTHPRILEEFSGLLEQYAGRNPDPIIQTVIPLLIEVNMHPIFDHLLMVYTPEEVQIERLMARENITREMAGNMVKSQMPVEDKKGYCDLLVDNSGTLEETRRQVEQIWSKLKELQVQRKKDRETGLKPAYPE